MAHRAKRSTATGGAVDPTLDHKFKVVFCGDSGVGKTSYIWRICNPGYVFDPFGLKTTLALDFSTRRFVIEGQQAVLQLWDTAGQERYRSLVRSYYRNTDCVVVMYDICSEQSFMNVQAWMQDIQEKLVGTGCNPAVMLLGNKVDLADVQPKPKRQVTYWQAHQLAQQNNATFSEVSAKSGHLVTDTTMELAMTLLAAKPDIMDESLLKLHPASDELLAERMFCCG